MYDLKKKTEKLRLSLSLLVYREIFTDKYYPSKNHLELFSTFSKETRKRQMYDLKKKKTQTNCVFQLFTEKFSRTGTIHPGNFL